ncbi:helix-turn-helix transcriptional regulator [Hymenobacter coccineus]|uniref:HTH araC/xylS-type domain-containing protein n=1 Tax=Hymenobacter coccineus TaxID=1908235 RepID=A0A1G1TK29_9BACT|nr:AraC family transcriptional regulator [Hymenobacter coccineus]OGX91233.1 hypothetical protein BEN49_05340 [Hymenobacter coccineus]
MKKNALPVLGLDQFPADSQRAHFYYVERLEDHLVRYPFVSTPHAHNFYLLLYVTRGRGTHTIDLVTHDLRPGSLFFLTPGQAHSWALPAEAQGYIFFFSAAFYLRQYPAERLGAYPFFDPARAPVLYLPPDETAIKALFASILAEKAAPADNQYEVVGAYLYLVLELAARPYAAQAAPHPTALAAQQVRTFGQLLDAHFRAEKTVGFYAGRLALTANHLNALCRRVLNKTASALIYERVVAEAQRRLVHSAEPVAAVADALGFDDASYFTRYFKKYVGQTPDEFRQHPPAG